MRNLLIIGLLVSVLVPAAVVAAPRVGQELQPGRQLTAVRKATARYHNVNAAIVAGYQPTETCTELPGEGGMGYHYVNPQLASDLVLDPLQPEVLLYAPVGNKLKLVGVEYFVAEAGQDHPTLFGQAFDGPMPGHEPDMPIHYDLHVWLWQTNPAGMFAAWNPDVRCTTSNSH